MIGCIVSGMRRGRKFHISKNYCVNIKMCAIFFVGSVKKKVDGLITTIIEVFNLNSILLLNVVFHLHAIYIYTK